MNPVTTRHPAVIPTVEAFRRACLYELRHLTGLRSTWIILAVVTALSLLTGITILLDLDKERTISSASMADVLAWSPVTTQIPALCFFVLALGTGPVSTDIVRGAAQTTWLAVNGRRTAYAAKCAVGFLAGAVIAAASAVLGALSSALVLTLTGAPQPAWTPLLGPVTRFTMWMGCWALLCIALVALLRNRIVPVVLLCMWPLLGERIAGMLLGLLPGLGEVGNWLPFAAGRAMLTDVSAFPADDRSFTQAMVGSNLTTPVATLLFCLYTAVVTAAGYWSYCRRDAVPR